MTPLENAEDKIGRTTRHVLLSVDEAAALRDELARLRRENEELHQKYLRLQALSVSTDVERQHCEKLMGEEIAGLRAQLSASERHIRQVWEHRKKQLRAAWDDGFVYGAMTTWSDKEREDKFFAMFLKRLIFPSQQEVKP